MSILLFLLWISVISVCLHQSIALNDVTSIEISIAPDVEGYGPSQNIVEITLWFNLTIYQYSFEPTDSTYSANASTFTILGSSNCHEDHNVTHEAKLMIELKHKTGADINDAVIIDSIVFRTSTTWYGISGRCVDDALRETQTWFYIDKYSDYIMDELNCNSGKSNIWMCVDPQTGKMGCRPVKQIFYFDTTRSNQSINDAAWSDGTNVVPEIVTCDPTENPTMSPSDDPSEIPSRFPSKSPIIITGYPTLSPSYGATTKEDHDKINPETTVEIGYSLIQYALISAFALIGFLGFIDARCIRRNDFFHLMFIFLSMLDVLDTLSDAFFAVDVFGTYSLATEHKSHFLMIFIASVSFIIIPVMISLYQLHEASSKHWLKNNKMRQWLLQYVAALYAVTILTGSSFGATFVFNSNLFDMNIFDMGLNRKYLLSWNTKKVYSILLFENVPQFSLSVWYSSMIGNITFIPAVQMLFSVISIIISTLTFCLQKKIYFTQDFVKITIDVKGQCVIDNLKVCQRRIKGLQRYLSQSVFGVHENAIDIEKPANIPNGVQLRMHIFHNDSDFNAAGHYQELLYDVIETRSLHERIQKEWKLSSAPSIGTEDIETAFFKSKEKKQISIAARQANTREGVPDTDEAIPFQTSDSIELQQIWTEKNHSQ